MGDLDSFIDMTGAMSQEEVNAQNISNIIDELNRNSDQLDSLNSTLSVIAYGSLVYSWNGSGSAATPLQATLSANITSSAAFIGLCYMQKASDATGELFQLPYTQEFENSNGDSVMAKNFLCGANTDTGTFQVDLNFFTTGTPDIFTFFYTILRQPSNISQS